MAKIKKQTIGFTQQDIKARKNSFALTSYERVTTFNFNEEDKEASIYTYNKALIKKLDKYCEQSPHLYKLINTDKYGKYISKTYSVPKEMISVNYPKDIPEKQSKIIDLPKLRVEQISVQLNLLNLN